MDLDQFVDMLVTEKGLNTEDPEVVAQIKEDLTSRIENRINALIMSSLAPDDLPAFEKVLDAGSEEEVQKFVHEPHSPLQRKLLLK